MENTDDMVKKAENIYDVRYREQYDETSRGKFAAIDIQSEKIYVADSAEDALSAAVKDEPDGQICLLKIGAPAAFRTSSIGEAA